MVMSGLRLQGNAATVQVWAPSAETVELCFLTTDGEETRHELDRTDDGNHSSELDPVDPGQRYGFRVHGPWDPASGLLCDPSRLLLDPYALAVNGEYVASPDDASPTRPLQVPLGVAVAAPPRPRPGPGIDWSDTVIYETHVKGLSMLHPEVPEDIRGTFLGASSPPIIDHLKDLGVTTVELMPVAHHVSERFLQKKGLSNYWGYSTLAWFAPHGPYATNDDGRQVAEFATMVDRFHAEGIEVVLDVVFNHTSEGGSTGPILSMKGLNNRGWYRVDPEDPRTYIDWTGTGNTINTQDPVVREAIVSALDWWANGLGVDGFRFDLAVTLGRNPVEFDSSHLDWIVEDPRLSGVKLIAEPWDLGPDGYQLGGFGSPWSEWNGRYRDQVRDVWRGLGNRRQLATRLAGSDDVYPHPARSVNLVTAHDGFTLADLVTYDHKHNEANGEANADGHDDNRSWNSGFEGETDNPDVLETRRRRISAMVVTLLMSKGTPMLLGGDELGRTQAGNNNAYAQDGPMVWYDWTNTVFVDLVAAATRCRRTHAQLLAETPARWDWHDPEGKPLQEWDRAGPLTAVVHGSRESLAMVFNPTRDTILFRVPGSWEIELDSSSPHRTGWLENPVEVGPWSVLILTELAGPS